MKGCCLLLLALFTLPFLGISQTFALAQPAAPAPHDQVLQNLEEMAFNRSNPDVFLAAQQRLKDKGSKAVPVLIEIFTSEQTQTDGWYEKAPEAIRTKTTAAQYSKRLQYQAYSGLTDLPETKDYLSSLITLLQDPRKEVRARTAWIISRHSHKADRSLLLTTLPALKDSEAEVRSNMIRVLGNATEIPAIKTALEEVLRDSDENVRSLAAYTLLMNADRNHAAALDTLVSLFSSTNVHTRYFAAHYYTISNPTNLRLETRLIPIYTNVLSVGNTNLQALAMRSLSRYGRRVQHVVPQLQEFLTSPHLTLRVAATNAMQEIQAGFIPGTPVAPASRELVLQHLQGIYSTNQAAAFQSIRAMGTNAIPLLIEILGYETTQADQWYDKAYAKAPSGIQSRMSKPEALEKLRSEAALLLGNMPETHLYMTNLFALLQDQRAEVRQHSAYLISSHMLNRGRNMEDSVMLECLPSLKDSDAQVRRSIAQAFAHKGAALPRVKVALEAVLNDPVEEVRLTTAHALLEADNKHTEALSTLKALFTSSTPNTRYFAAVYYFVSDRQRFIGDPDLMRVFIDTLSGSDVSLQSYAAELLGRIGAQAKPAVPELKKLLLSPEAQVRTAATNALQRIAPGVLPPVKP